MRVAWRSATARAKAQKLAQEFGVPQVYDGAEKLICPEKPDFVDIITDVNTQRQYVELAAAQKTPVICQKRLAPMRRPCSRYAGKPLR